MNSHKHLLDIEQDGANARARGVDLLDCPYYYHPNLPVDTGDTIEEWSQKFKSWEFGWKIENLKRTKEV